MPLSPPHTSPALEAARNKFIALWGDMATNWGISRTMAQIYALLFSSAEAMDTDHIMAELNISRGNANMNLRKLLEWGLVRKGERGDTRRDFFEAEKDVWQMTRNIIIERCRREIEPVEHKLQEIAETMHQDDQGQLRELTPEEALFEHHLLEMRELIALSNELMKGMLPLLENRNNNRLDEIIKSLK